MSVFKCSQGRPKIRPLGILLSLTLSLTSPTMASVPQIVESWNQGVINAIHSAQLADDEKRNTIIYARHTNGEITYFTPDTKEWHHIGYFMDSKKIFASGENLVRWSNRGRLWWLVPGIGFNLVGGKEARLVTLSSHLLYQVNSTGAVMVLNLKDSYARRGNSNLNEMKRDWDTIGQFPDAIDIKASGDFLYVLTSNGVIQGYSKDLGWKILPASRNFRPVKLFASGSSIFARTNSAIFEYKGGQGWQLIYTMNAGDNLNVMDSTGDVIYKASHLDRIVSRYGALGRWNVVTSVPVGVREMIVSGDSLFIRNGVGDLFRFEPLLDSKWEKLGGRADLAQIEASHFADDTFYNFAMTDAFKNICGAKPLTYEAYVRQKSCYEEPNNSFNGLAITANLARYAPHYLRFIVESIDQMNERMQKQRQTEILFHDLEAASLQAMWVEFARENNISEDFPDLSVMYSSDTPNIAKLTSRQLLIQMMQKIRERLIQIAQEQARNESHDREIRERLERDPFDTNDDGVYDDGEIRDACFRLGSC